MPRLSCVGCNRCLSSDERSVLLRGPFFLHALTHPQVKRPMHMAKVVLKLLNGDYCNEGGMIADLRLMVENCRRYVRFL